jgi:hypothetical protein
MNPYNFNQSYIAVDMQPKGTNLELLTKIVTEANLIPLTEPSSFEHLNNAEIQSTLAAIQRIRAIIHNSNNS